MSVTFGEVTTIEEYFGARDRLERKTLQEAATRSHAVAPAYFTLPDLQLPEEPPPATVYVDQRLRELDEVATTVLKRLEGGEALSAVLPSAYRLAAELGDLEVARWLTMEIEGFRSGIRPRTDLQDDEVAGVGRFFKMRSVPPIERYASAPPAGGLEPRSHLLSHSIGELETILNVARSATSIPELLALQETRRVLDTIRLEVLTWTTKARHRVQADRAAVELLGPDALGVFDAGGRTLLDLRRAVTSLRSGSAANGAQLARNSLVALGTLYRGPVDYTSPIDGSRHKATGERNLLHALLDELWTKTADEDRKQLLATAHDELERAYKLGSKAKEPGGLSHAEAVEAITLAFNVARAVSLAAGFPLAVKT